MDGQTGGTLTGVAPTKVATIVLPNRDVIILAISLTAMLRLTARNAFPLKTDLTAPVWNTTGKG